MKSRCLEVVEMSGKAPIFVPQIVDISSMPGMPFWCSSSKMTTFGPIQSLSGEVKISAGLEKKTWALFEVTSDRWNMVEQFSPAWLEDDSFLLKDGFLTGGILHVSSRDCFYFGYCALSSLKLSLSQIYRNDTLSRVGFLLHFGQSLHDTVDGWNPAPVDREVFPVFSRVSTSQVVQDFFHQQYFMRFLRYCLSTFASRQHCTESCFTWVKGYGFESTSSILLLVHCVSRCRPRQTGGQLLQDPAVKGH